MKVRGPVLFWKTSGIKMTGVSEMSLLNFVVLARFLALTANVWQGNDRCKRQEMTMNQSKTNFLEVGIWKGQRNDRCKGKK